MSSGLRIMTTLLGVALCALSIMLNFQLYTSLAGSSGIERFSYQYIGVSFDIAKVTCLLLAVFFWFKSDDKGILMGVFCFFFYVVLSGISLSAGWGFGLNTTMHAESEKLQGSLAMQSLQMQAKNAQAKADKLSNFATLDAKSAGELELLKTRLEYQESQLASCPRTYVTVCIKPAQALIASIQADIAKVKARVDGHQAYQNAMSEQSAVMAKMSGLDSSALQESVMHPLFIALGNLFDVAPQKAKETLLLVSFIVLELLGSLFFAIGMMQGNKNSTGGGDGSRRYDGDHQRLADGDHQSGRTFKKPRLSQAAIAELYGNGQTSTASGQSSTSSGQTSTPIEENQAGVVDERTPPLTRGVADSDVDGENSTRYNALKNAVISRKIKPTLKDIQRFKHGGVSCRTEVAKRFQEGLLKEGIIETYALNNGRTSYRMKGVALVQKEEAVEKESAESPVAKEAVTS